MSIIENSHGNTSCRVIESESGVDGYLRKYCINIIEVGIWSKRGVLL